MFTYSIVWFKFLIDFSLNGKTHRMSVQCMVWSIIRVPGLFIIEHVGCNNKFMYTRTKGSPWLVIVTSMHKR